MNHLLATRALSLGYTQAAPLVQNVNLNFPSGELICLTGPNGSGKSTLLRTLAGLQAPLSGDVLLDGSPMPECSEQVRARLLAMVFARFPSGSYLRGHEYVALGRSPHTGWFDRLRKNDWDIVDRVLHQTDATHLAESFIDDLSDGERQRLAVARALAQEPRILLLDEPTAYLDLPHRVQLYRLLREQARQKNLCVIMSTHELDLALRFADRMVLLDGKKDLCAGIPESLALNGSIARAFAAPGVFFDIASGGFHVEQGNRFPISLHGQGDAVQWTRRALHRLGYHFVNEGFPSITVSDQEQDTCWEVRLNAHDTFVAHNLETALTLLPKETR